MPRDDAVFHFLSQYYSNAGRTEAPPEHASTLPGICTSKPGRPVAAREKESY